MTLVATKRKRRTEGEKPQAARARAGQKACGDLLRTATDTAGVVWAQHCDARPHGDDERHHPSATWTEVPIEDQVF